MEHFLNHKTGFTSSITFTGNSVVFRTIIIVANRT